MNWYNDDSLFRDPKEDKEEIRKKLYEEELNNKLYAQYMDKHELRHSYFNLDTTHGSYCLKGVWYVYEVK